MNKIFIALSALIVFLALGTDHEAWADDGQPGYYDTYAQPESGLLTPEEVEDLVAPIALYPDPLIAQILPAATFADQIDEAARYVRQFGRAARIDLQPWDLSVKAVAHYPDVLYMMDQKYDWTVSLGQAFIDQPQDLMDAIQNLRADALAQGNLFSNREQQVIEDQDGIRIVPATPEFVYVPVYDPQVVYVERYNPSYPFISFGIGLSIGAWLSRDFNWREHRVYYHGWKGGGWVGRSRPIIHDTGHVYINKRAADINLNRKVLQHDTSRFRRELQGETRRRQEEHQLPGAAGRPNQPRPGVIDRRRPAGPGQQKPEDRARQRAPEAGQPQTHAVGQQRPQQPAPEQRPARYGRPVQPGAEQRPSTGTAPQPAGQPRPSAVRPQPAPTPAPAAAPVAPPAAERQRQPEARPNVFRGRDVQQAQPASQSGYGGYGTGKDATIYRQRGQSSRENMQRTNRPTAAPVATTAPAPRTAAPAPAPRPAPAVAPAPRPAPAAAPAPRQVAPSAPRPAPAPAARPGAPERERQQHQ